MKIVSYGYNFYLCDEQRCLSLENFIPTSFFKLLDLRQYYAHLEGYELGTYEYLFETVNWFDITRLNNTFLTEDEYSTRTIQLSEKFIGNFKAWLRDIKINNILND